MLEPRLLLSADLSFVALTGQSLDLTLRLEDSRQEVQIIDNTNQTVLHSQVFAGTRSVVIRGADKDDKLTIDLSTPFSLPEGITFEDSSASDNDMLEVIGQANLFNITGKNEGNVVNGAIEFAGIENLIGSISGTIDGRAGCFDTVQIQEDNYDIVSFDYTGSDSGNIKLDGAVIALYSRMEAIALTSSGRSPPTTVMINIPTAASDEFTLRDDGTSGNGLITIDSVNGTFIETAFEAPTGSLTINTGPGSDTITLEVLELGFDLFIDGEAGSDTLIGPHSNCTWNITGANAGNVAGVDFSSIENLTGAAGNEDTFEIFPDGSISGLVDGGAGGFDCLAIEGGTYNTVVFTPTGPDSGTVELDGNVITYSGLEPIVSPVPTIDIIFNLTSSDDQAVIEAGSGGDMQIRSDNSTFETTTFSIPTGSLTIIGEEGDDSVTVADDLIMPGADLAISAETITANSGVTITAGDITFMASATDNGMLGDLLDVDLELDFLNDVILADSAATVNVIGAILNGTDITLNATSFLDLDSSGFSMSVLTLAVISAQSNAEVIVENAQITASGNLNIFACSDVIASAAIGAVSGTDTQTDAAIAISVIDSSADAHVSGTSQLIVGGGVNLSATNTVTVRTIADGSTSGAAGASLALSVVKGTTKAYIAGTVSINDTDDADSISVKATTISTVMTTAKSTPKGAEKKSSSNNETEKKLTKYDAGTSDGSINIAGALAISDVIRPTEAYISSSNTVVSGGNIDIAATSSNRVSAIADGIATGSGATGVGVAVALNIADIDSRAYIAGAADLTADAVTIDATVAGRQWLSDPSTAVNNIDDTIDLSAPHGFRTGDTAVYSSGEGSAITNLTDGETYYLIVDDTSPNTVKLATTEQNAKDGVAIDLDNSAATGLEHSLTEKESRFYAEATSGAGGSSKVSVAGSLAINVVMVDTDAYIESGALINVHGADMNISASSKTKSTVKALPKETTSGGSLGLGASVALNIADNNTRAAINDSAGFTGPTDPGNISLSATGNYKMTTQAKAGAKATGGVAITPVVAISIANNDTTAEIGTDGSVLILTGNLEAQASQTTSTSTKATGAAEGTDAAVGASLALAVVADQALATTARSISASGDISFVATSSSLSKSNAKASAKGGKKKSTRDPSKPEYDPNQPENVDQETGSQRTFADNTAGSKGASGSGSTTTPTSSSSDGPVVVAAAISVNIAESTASAYIPDGVTINAAGVLTISATNNTDAYATADGNATKGSIGIGAAVAVNYADVVTEAYIGNATVNAEGVTVQATKNDEEWSFNPTTDVDSENQEWAFSPSTAVNNSAETINLGATHGLETGDMVVYKSGEGNDDIGGLKDGNIYYVIITSSTTVKLASSAANAKAGTAIDLDSTAASGSGHKLIHSHETIYIGPDHGLKTGDVVVYESGEGNDDIGGLKDGEIYYVIFDDTDPNKVKLAKSATDAYAGRPIDLDKSEATGTSHKLVHKSSFYAEATSGAGATDVSVAGSLGLNIVDNRSEAVVKSGAVVNADGSDGDAVGSDVTVKAESTSVNAATANSKVTGSGDVGVGASVALNVINDNVTRAEIENTAVLTHAGNVELTATSDHLVRTKTQAGASGDVAVSPAVAISIIDNDTTALVGSAATPLDASGTVDAKADHTSSVKTIGDAVAAGSDVGVGAAVGVAVTYDTVLATVARNVTAGNTVTIEAKTDIDGAVETKASAKGNKSSSDGGKDADTEANEKVKNNSNTETSTDLPKANDKTTDANSTSSSESSTGSSSVGVAAAVSVNVVTVDITASIQGGADVDAGSGSVLVSAKTEVDATAKALGIAVELSESNNVGAAVSLNVVDIENKAFVAAGSIIEGNGITIEAVTTGNKKNEFIVWGAAAGGGTGDVGVAGSVGINVVNITTEASARAGSHLLSDSSLIVTAENDMVVQTLAAGGGFSSGTAVGAAVAVAVVTSSNKAFIAGDADAAGAMSITAETYVSPLKVDVPLLGDSDDPTITSLAVAGGASSGDVGVAGAVVVDIFNLTTHAYLDDNSNINQDTGITPSGQSVTVHAIDETEITSIAGSLGLSVGSVGVGAGVDVGVITKDTRAYIGSGAQVGSAGAVSVDADSSETILSIAANAGIGNSVGVAGSASVQVVNTGTRAYIEHTPSGTAPCIDADGDVTISANGTFTAKMIAGSVGGGSSAGIGASNTTLVHNDTVEAYVGERASVTSEGTTGLSVTAHSSEDLITIAAAGAGAGTAAVAGSAVVNVLNETTYAFVGKSATITTDNASAAGSPSIFIDASDDTTIISVAGSLAGAGTAAVGLGADVGVITKETKAYIDSNVTATAEGDIMVTATSSEDITSVAAGVSISGSASVALDASVHVFDIITRAFIGDEDGVGSAGHGNVHANGSVVISADDVTEVDKIVGVLAVAGYAGVGAAGGVTIINKTTEAFIGNGAYVTGDGNTAGITVRTGAFEPGIDVSASTFDPNNASGEGIEANGSSAVEGDTTTLSGQGEVNVPDLAEMDADQQGGDDLGDGSFTGQRTVEPGERENFHGVAVTATNRDDIEVFTISLAGGVAGVAISAAVNVVNTTTQAYIGQNARVNEDTSGAGSSQSVHIAAGNDFYHLAVAGTLGVGVVGVSPAADVTVLGNTTKSLIKTGAIVNAKNDITVEAHAREDLLLIGFGIGGGVVGIGGAVSVLTIDNVTTASIGANACVSAGGDVLVYATDDTDSDMISGALAGGFVGVGASVGVLKIDKETTGSIENGAHVDALGAGTGISGVLNGTITGGGDDFGTTTAHGVIVQAQSSEDIFHLAVAGGAGFVGVSGAVAVTLIDSDTTAYIGQNAYINQTGGNTGADPDQSVFVGASNEVRVTSFAGAVAGGVVGMGGAINVGTIKNDTSAKILSGARVTAQKDVEVNALGIKELDGFTFSGAGGLVGLSASVSVWSLGTTIEKNYENDEEGTSANALEGEGGGTADTDAAGQAQSAHSEVSGLLDGFDDDSGNSNQSSTKRVGSATSAASSTLPGSAPSQSDITGTIDSGAPTVGTVASIESGAVVDAGEDIEVTANEDVEVDIIVGGVAGGLVGLGAAISIINIAANTSAHAAGTLSAGSNISIDAILDEDVDIISLAAVGGYIGLGAAVVVVDDSTVVQARIGNGADILAADTRSVPAHARQERPSS
jgi:hypothetical protein